MIYFTTFICGFPSQGRDRHGLACGAASFAELAPKSTGGADDWFAALALNSFKWVYNDIM